MGLAEPRLGALVGVLAPLLGTVGTAVTWLLLVLVMGFHDRWPQRDELLPLVWLPLGAIVIGGGATGLLLHPWGRRALRQTSTAGRWQLIVVAWLGPLGYAAVLVIGLSR